MNRVRPAIERLMAKRRINPQTGCWEFTGYILQGTGRYERLSGYAYIRDDASRGGKLILVHRLAYRELVGPIPKGFDVDHDCIVRHCFNPEHLLCMSRTHHIALTVFRNARGQIEDIPFP